MPLPALIVPLFFVATSAVTIEKSAAVNRGASVELTIAGGELLLTRSAANRVNVKVRCDAGMAKDPAHENGCRAAQLSIDGGPDALRVGFRLGDTKGLPVRPVLAIELPDGIKTTIRSGGGSIAIHGVHGSIACTTAGGDIVVRGATSMLAFKSGGGSIDVDEASNVESSTSGGDITIGRASGTVKLRTGAGNIRVGSLAGSIDAVTDEGNVTLDVAPSASGTIRAVSHRGDVRVRVAPSWPMAIRAQLDWDASKSRTYRIDSAWPVATTTSRRFDGARQEPRKVVSGVATAGAGTNAVTLEAIDGDIHIQRMEGKSAPALTTAKWLKGTPVPRFEHGKVYVLDIWAPWCGPCLGGMQHLTDLQKKNAARGLVVIGMTGPDDYGSTLQSASKVLVQKGAAIGYSIAWDEGHRLFDVWMANEKGRGWPWSFIIDRNGRVAWSGHPEGLDAALEKLL